jgi:sulfur carrier protein
MQVQVNGEATEVSDRVTVAALVATVSTAHRGVAVAVAGEVVPRGEWESRVLAAGDEVEILTAVQGG